MAVLKLVSTYEFISYILFLWNVVTDGCKFISTG